MRWTKLGLLFTPEEHFIPTGRSGWMTSHAAVPFGRFISQDVLRVYFNCRDRENRAPVGCFDIDVARHRVVSVHPVPVLDLGPLGAFDDHGVIGSWIVERDGVQYLYFSGITLGVSVPYYFYLGLAVSVDGGTSFRRVSPSPILERDAVDPYLTGQVCVRVEDDRWRMWYVSGVSWKEDAAGHARHCYNIKHAESEDGVHWKRDGTVCIDLQNDEYAIARPCVLRDGDVYRMWFCSRGPNYSIGYAESADGLTWKRHEHPAAAATDWDSEMSAYPFVFDHGSHRFMLYNGNDYGGTGIGWAVLDGDEEM